MKRGIHTGQAYTARDGTRLYRIVHGVHEQRVPGHPDPVPVVFYRTNRGQGVHACQLTTFKNWVRTRAAVRTQRYRRRALTLG